MMYFTNTSHKKMVLVEFQFTEHVYLKFGYAVRIENEIGRRYVLNLQKRMLLLKFFHRLGPERF